MLTVICIMLNFVGVSFQTKFNVDKGAAARHMKRENQVKWQQKKNENIFIGFPIVSHALT